MAGSWLWLLSPLILLLTTLPPSYGQQDPMTDFCRRFGHQSCIIDRKLYIDGGQINYNPLSENPFNYTNYNLLYYDLDVLNDIMPQLYNNLTKNSSIPSVSGGVLWADEVNKLFYLYGGETDNSPPQEFSFWYYDVVYDMWNLSSSDTSDVLRAAWGAGIAVNDIAKGYYYGGWLNNASVPGWGSEPMALSSLLIYDMIGNAWTNNSGPDTTRRAEGVMLYLPVSDGGMLVYFGGVSTPYYPSNGSVVFEDMSQIRLYDIASSKWYTQTAAGDVPKARRRFCAGATWAQDFSSYNIYLYGGASAPPDTVGFDDVYILTIPSFRWIKWYPTQPGTAYPHHSLTCNVVDNSQMLIIGGTFPNSSQCDAATLYGTHNLNLGKNNIQKALWYSYMPNITTYEVPPEIIDEIGGKASGGATVQSPSQGWGDRDLPVYFTRLYTQATRMPTRYIPSSTAAPSNTTSSSHTGAIVGGTVGGVVALCCIIGIIIWSVRCKRQKRPGKFSDNSGTSGGGRSEVIDPISELPANNPTSPSPISPQSASGYAHLPTSYRNSPTGTTGTGPPPLSSEQPPPGYQSSSSVPSSPLSPSSQTPYLQSVYPFGTYPIYSQGFGVPSTYPSPPPSIAPTPAHFYSSQYPPSPTGRQQQSTYQLIIPGSQPLYPAPLALSPRSVSDSQVQNVQRLEAQGRQWERTHAPPGNADTPNRGVNQGAIELQDQSPSRSEATTDAGWNNSRERELNELYTRIDEEQLQSAAIIQAQVQGGMMTGVTGTDEIKRQEGVVDS